MMKELRFYQYEVGREKGVCNLVIIAGNWRNY